MRLEAQVEHPGEGADQQRLGEAGHADEQGMAAAEDRHQDLFDHRLLADDDPPDLLLHPAVDRVQCLDCCFVVLTHE